VGEIADGVIIGSRLVREIAEAPAFDRGLEGVERFLGETATALQSE
jgi:tryptophan synthase alpha subunit